MAQDRPTASELLAAIADFLREEATPVLDRAEPGLGFQMRVAANSLAILEREARLGPGRRCARARTAGEDCSGARARSTNSTANWPTSSAPAQRDERDAALMAHLEATIADKIAIANPKWR